MQNSVILIKLGEICESVMSIKLPKYPSPLNVYSDLVNELKQKQRDTNTFLGQNVDDLVYELNDIISYSITRMQEELIHAAIFDLGWIKLNASFSGSEHRKETISRWKELHDILLRTLTIEQMTEFQKTLPYIHALEAINR